MEISAFSLAQRFIGTEEMDGTMDNHQLMAMLKLDMNWPEHDEVPWCSAFANYICWLLHLPRSKSLLARSWLGVGFNIELENAAPFFDVVILQRGTGDQPGPENVTASGHVGFFAGVSADFEWVELLGGNQGDQVKISRYPVSRILGIRRLLNEE